MTPETLLRAVDEVQAGQYPVDAGEAEAVRALIKQHG
jgi:hypothetical protein